MSPDLDETKVRKRYQIYLAAPLFSDAEIRYNRYLADILEEIGYVVYLPQEAGECSSERSQEENQILFITCKEAIDAAEIVIAVVDGSDADSGTSWEMGYAYAKGKPVYAVRTDKRRIGINELVNLMLERSSKVVNSLEQLITSLPAHPPWS